MLCIHKIINAEFRAAIKLQQQQKKMNDSYLPTISIYIKKNTCPGTLYNWMYFKALNKSCTNHSRLLYLFLVYLSHTVYNTFLPNLLDAEYLFAFIAHDRSIFLTIAQ